jgi:hypothetical protein
MTPEEVRAEHDQRMAAARAAGAPKDTAINLDPTPTQEEMDLMRLGLMNPDDKAHGKPISRSGEAHHDAAHRATRTGPPTPTSTTSA